jgi:hypothetical protein
MSGIKTRIAKAEQCLGMDGRDDVLILTDEQLEQIRADTRTAWERGMSLAEFWGLRAEDLEQIR